MMTTETFSNALGDVDERYIAEAADYTVQRKKHAWGKWVAAAACLSVMIAGGLFGNLFRSPDEPDAADRSLFVIKAQALDGETRELNVGHGYFNSVVPGEEGNAFGVDMPLFYFQVCPSDYTGEKSFYESYRLRISYNGKTVTMTDKDDHIRQAYCISTIDSSISYGVMGWFEEPTELFVEILDRQSETILETATVRVSYVEQQQGYALEITDRFVNDAA